MPTHESIAVADHAAIPPDASLILTDEATGVVRYVPELGGWWECTITSNEQTLGISVVGMAQAGKSTFCGIVDRYVAVDLGAPGGNFNFPVSNGNRGITARILEAAQLPPDEPISLDKQTYGSLVNSFVTAQQDMSGLLRTLYADPAPKEVLRSRAVNSAVAWTDQRRFRTAV